jgi:hypothetical protein
MPITMMRSSAKPPTDDPMMTTARFDCVLFPSTGLGFWIVRTTIKNGQLYITIIDKMELTGSSVVIGPGCVEVTCPSPAN